MTPARVRIRHFTDPGCPFAFTAERQRLRLRWQFGDQLEWELHMVGLSSEAVHDDERARRVARSFRRLYDEYGMPIDWTPRRYLAATVHACRAVVAVRLRRPEAEDAYLRALRVLGMGGMLLDDSDTLEIAAERAGLPVRELAAFAASPEVQAVLDDDMAAARAPSPAARAQPERLGGPGDERRYSCPSYEIARTGDGARLDVPGFRPIEAYVAALANLAPELERREDPESVVDVLDWAPYPLATAEVAAVCDRDIGDVRLELARSRARFEPVGGDGYWSASRPPLPRSSPTL
jgi:predicted DsbA family dithiol-disulfide isomerase